MPTPVGTQVRKFLAKHKRAMDGRTREGKAARRKAAELAAARATIIVVPLLLLLN